MLNRDEITENINSGQILIMTDRLDSVEAWRNFSTELFEIKSKITNQNDLVQLIKEFRRKFENNDDILLLLLECLNLSPLHELSNRNAKMVSELLTSIITESYAMLIDIKSPDDEHLKKIGKCINIAGRNRIELRLLSKISAEYLEDIFRRLLVDLTNDNITYLLAQSDIRKLEEVYNKMLHQFKVAKFNSAFNDEDTTRLQRILLKETYLPASKEESYKIALEILGLGVQSEANVRPFFNSKVQQYNYLLAYSFLAENETLKKYAIATLIQLSIANENNRSKVFPGVTLDANCYDYLSKGVTVELRTLLLKLELADDKKSPCFDWLKIYVELGDFGGAKNYLERLNIDEKDQATRMTKVYHNRASLDPRERDIKKRWFKQAILLGSEEILTLSTRNMGEYGDTCLQMIKEIETSGNFDKERNLIKIKFVILFAWLPFHRESVLDAITKILNSKILLPVEAKIVFAGLANHASSHFVDCSISILENETDLAIKLYCLEELYTNLSITKEQLYKHDVFTVGIITKCLSDPTLNDQAYKFACAHPRLSNNSEDNKKYFEALTDYCAEKGFVADTVKYAIEAVLCGSDHGCEMLENLLKKEDKYSMLILEKFLEKNTVIFSTKFNDIFTMIFKIMLEKKDSDGLKKILLYQITFNVFFISPKLTIDAIDLIRRDKKMSDSLFLYDIHQNAISNDTIKRDLIKKLIGKNNEYLNVKNKFGETPLLDAAAHGCKDTVELLLGYKDIDLEASSSHPRNASRTGNGNTAIDWAIDKGHMDIVMMLFMKGAKLTFEKRSISTNAFVSLYILDSIMSTQYVNLKIKTMNQKLEDFKIQSLAEGNCFNNSSLAKFVINLIQDCVAIPELGDQTVRLLCPLAEFFIPLSSDNDILKGDYYSNLAEYFDSKNPATLETKKWAYNFAEKAWDLGSSSNIKNRGENEKIQNSRLDKNKHIEQCAVKPTIYDQALTHIKSNRVASAQTLLSHKNNFYSLLEYINVKSGECTREQTQIYGNEKLNLKIGSFNNSTSYVHLSIFGYEIKFGHSKTEKKEAALAFARNLLGDSEVQSDALAKHVDALSKGELKTHYLACAAKK